MTRLKSLSNGLVLAPKDLTMNIRHITIFIVVQFFFISAFSTSFAQQKCIDIFLSQIKSNPMTNRHLLSFLEPLKVSRLVRKVDLRNNFDPTSLDPSLGKMIYTKEEAAVFLKDLQLPLDEMKNSDRWIETDYGFALMDVHTLRDWTLLEAKIKDEKAAKKFIDYVGQNDGVYPLGIMRESADWLRWSVFANVVALNKAIKNKRPEDFLDFDGLADFYREKKAEYRRLVRQKEVFMFPFGTDGRLKPNEMTESAAAVVLPTLARYHILNRLYVKDVQSGKYQLLSEYLDKDTLMLFSRFPELLPAYPVFEGRHFSINNDHTLIGHEDGGYILVSKNLFKKEIKQNIAYEVSFRAEIDTNAYAEGVPIESIGARFQIHMYDKTSKEALEADNLSDREFKTIFRQELGFMQSYISQKADAFRQLTGYDLPEPKVVESKESYYTDREFEVRFKPTPQYILTSFFVFAGLD